MRYDFPAPAYAKACQLVDDFDALTAEYMTLLGVQGAMLANDNYDGILHHTARGDAIARRVAAYSGQLQSLQNTLMSGQYAGARTHDLMTRFDRARIRADVVGRGAMRLAAACAVQRDAAGAGLRAEGAAAGSLTRTGVGAYRAFDRRLGNLDIAI